MAVSCSRAGRPCWVAVIASSRDRQLAFWDEFVDACSKLHYRDIVAISRRCGVTVNAVERWKYGLNYPRKERAEEIIDWIKAGKPMEKVRPFSENVGML